MNLQQSLARLKEADEKLVIIEAHEVPIRPMPLLAALVASAAVLYAVLYGVWYLIPVGEYLISGGR